MLRRLSYRSLLVLPVNVAFHLLLGGLLFYALPYLVLLPVILRLVAENANSSRNVRP